MLRETVLGMWCIPEAVLHAGGCGVLNTTQHRLYSQPPAVFTMQIAWQTASATAHDIKAAMLGLREV